MSVFDVGVMQPISISGRWCSVYINGELEPIINVYGAGIELARENPEGSAKVCG